MSGGNIMVRFKALDGAWTERELVDTGFIKLRTKRFGSADEIENMLWNELNQPYFKQFIRNLAEKCAATQEPIATIDPDTGEKTLCKNHRQ